MVPFPSSTQYFTICMCRHIIVLQEKQIVQHLELHNQPSIEDLQYLGHLSVFTLAVLHISFFWLCHSSSCSPCANSTPLFCYFYHVSQVSKFCLFFLFSHLSVFQSSIFTVYLLLSYSYKFSLFVLILSFLFSQVFSLVLV